MAWLDGPWVAGWRRRRRGTLRAKSWNKVYSMCRYPFMNNNGCRIYFILFTNLLVWIEIINIQKLVTHVTRCDAWRPLYVCYTATPGSFKALGQSGAPSVKPTTGIWLRALNLIPKIHSYVISFWYICFQLLTELSKILSWSLFIVGYKQDTFLVTFCRYRDSIT